MEENLHNFTPLEVPNTKADNIKKILTYLGVLALVVVFLATIGIRIIISIGIYVANFAKPKVTNTQPQKKSQDFMGPPEIINVPLATNSARLKIKGTTPIDTKISIILNSNVSSEVDGNNGLFEASLTLLDGVNTIKAQYLDANTSITKSSPEVIISLKTSKPKLEITSPKDNEGISGNEVSIAGSTEKETTITINNAPVIVDNEGKFVSSYRLKSGDNEINIIATDIAGNSTEEKLSINFAGN